MQRENNFNLLRFLFAGMVILSHSYSLSGIQMPFSSTFNFGKYAVYGFFILSGFLVTASLEKTNKLIIFIKKRFFRIFPGLFVMSAIVTLSLGFISACKYLNYINDKNTIMHFICTILLIPAHKCIPNVFNNNPEGCAVNGSLWSIRYEVLFYLLLASLYFIKREKRKYLVKYSFFSVLILLYIWNLYRYTIPENINYHLDRILNLSTYFLGGSMIFYFPNITQSSNILIKAISLLLIGYMFGIHNYTTPLTFPILIIFIGNTKNTKFLRNKWGDCSYGMYIYAFPIQQAIIQIVPNLRPKDIFISALILAIIWGYLSWHLIEKKFKVSLKLH